MRAPPAVICSCPVCHGWWWAAHICFGRPEKQESGLPAGGEAGGPFGVCCTRSTAGAENGRIQHAQWVVSPSQGRNLSG